VWLPLTNNARRGQTKTKKHGGYLFDGANERVARRRLCWCGYNSGGESEH